MHHHNRFLLLIIAALVLFGLLFLSMNSVQKEQNLQSRAAKPSICQQNIDCPQGAMCQNGSCILQKISPTQSPLSYASVSQIDQEAKPIPSYFVEPTPTPQPNILLRIAYGINSFIGGIFSATFNFVDTQLQNVTGNL